MGNGLALMVKPLGILRPIWGTTTVVIRISRSLPALILMSTPGLSVNEDEGEWVAYVRF